MTGSAGGGGGDTEGLLTWPGVGEGLPELSFRGILKDQQKRKPGENSRRRDSTGKQCSGDAEQLLRPSWMAENEVGTSKHRASARPT